VEDAQLMQEVLTQFTVRQNYPNPFNPSTNIEYSLPEDGFAEVSIYTINGELIRTLYSGEQSAGTHNLSWNSRNSSGSSVSSGIYLYQVRFNNSVMTKKMLLLK
jgi:flagellar hook assembly protein FlgD